MTGIDHHISRWATRQHGLVSRRQLASVGIGSEAVRRRVRRGTLHPVSSRVLAIAGSADTPNRRLMAAVLDVGPGALVSHRSAAAIWDLPGFFTEPIHVTGRRGATSGGRTDLAIVHVPRRVLAGHHVEIDGIPVTTPTRTIFDLAGMGLHPGRVERALDTLWARGRVDHASLTAMLEQLAAKGRSGIALMRSLITARGATYRPPESNAEVRFQELARRSGLPGFVRQVDVGGSDRWIGRVDFVDPLRRLVVEVDPGLHHGSLTDQRHDEQRRADLVDAGWLVEVVTDVDLFHRADDVGRRLARMRSRRPDPVLATHSSVFDGPG